VSIEFDRQQVLAHRVHAHEFDRRVSSPADLAVLDLGIQDTPVGAARQALAARLPGSSAPDGAWSDDALFGGTDPLALVWSHRGSPHLHRADDLVGLARALWPWSDADARARMGRAATRLEGAGIAPLEGLRLTAEAWHSVVTGSGSGGLTKGEISAAVTERLPDEVPEWCRGCQSTHVNELLFRLGALPAGARIVPGRTPLTFVPVSRWAGVPDTPTGTDRVVASYLQLLGPATEVEAAGFLGTTAKAIGTGAGGEAGGWLGEWPEGLVRVRVDGQDRWMAETDVDEVAAAPKPEMVRLVPASDPYLQTRDRELLVPDSARRQALWKVLSSPGALLVDGEVAGIWRAKQTKATKSDPQGVLVVTVEAFGRLDRATRSALDQEAQGLARVRGLEAAAVRVP
jgi:hypothetical protein